MTTAQGVNPLTEVLDSALAMVQERETELFALYGVPLFTDAKTAMEWPTDPELTSPEQMSLLVQTRGTQAVNTWLAEFFTRKAEAAQFAIDKLAPGRSAR